MTIINFILVSINGKVIESRKIKLRCYEIIDAHNDWEKLSLICLYESIISSCADAYHIFQNNIYKRLNEKNYEKTDSLFVEFRNKFLHKEIDRQYLNSKQLGIKQSLNIIRLQKKQDYNYYWEKEYIKFKTGWIVPNPLNKSLFNSASILLSLLPLCVTIIVTINVVPSETFLFRLVFLGVMFLADLVSLFARIKVDIKTEIKNINFYNRIISDYVYSSNYSFLNSLAYYSFYRYEIPDDKIKRKYNMNGLLSNHRDVYYNRHSYVPKKEDY